MNQHEINMEAEIRGIRDREREKVRKIIIDKLHVCAKPWSSPPPSSNVNIELVGPWETGWRGKAKFIVNGEVIEDGTTLFNNLMSVGDKPGEWTRWPDHFKGGNEIPIENFTGYSKKEVERLTKLGDKGVPITDELLKVMEIRPPAPRTKADEGAKDTFDHGAIMDKGIFILDSGILLIIILIIFISLGGISGGKRRRSKNKY